MKPSKQSRELAGAFVEDQRRQAIDAAKKRAVAQQVDYDAFKNMVRMTCMLMFSLLRNVKQVVDGLCRYLLHTSSLCKPLRQPLLQVRDIGTDRM